MTYLSSEMRTFVHHGDTSCNQLGKEGMDTRVEWTSLEDLKEDIDVLRQRHNQVDVLEVELQRGLDELKDLDITVVNNLDFLSYRIVEGPFCCSSA